MMTSDHEWRAFAALAGDRLAKPVAGVVCDAENLRNKAEGQNVPELLHDFDRIITSSRKLETMIEKCHQRPSDGEKTVKKAKADFRHDLRTPINAIKGYGRLMMEEFKDRGIDVMNDDFDRLLNNAERLEREVAILSGGNKTAGPEPACGKEAGATVASIAGFRVLVVDDDKVSRDFLSRLLQRRGCGVETASSGAEALDKLSKGGADLILLDMLMPAMDGLGVLKLLKAQRRLKTIPVVMVSGVDDDTPLIQCLEAGAEAFLNKPVSFDDLMNVLLQRKDKPSPTLTATKPPGAYKALIIDHSRIEAIRLAMGPDTLLELISDFHKLSAGKAGDIHRAAINDDMKTWGRSAHDLKNAAGIMGLARLSEICREIEDACDEGRADDAVRLTGVIDDHLGEALAALDNLGSSVGR